ncbi:hypothetical protein FRC18_009722 [Serendipita sp. 400]|nr:hypothetical protein FRC18_009722 [Serendipita sp. 400]
MDDCWHAPERSPHPPHPPVADPERFPDGIKALSEKIHAMGLKIGIYSSAGTMTCARRFGSLGYEEIDAQTYKDWDIDYLKYDNCYNEGQAGYDLISYNRYAKMSRALSDTGRPIVYAMCNWGEDGTWNWAPTIAHSWRMSGDIIDVYDGFDDRCPCESALNCKLPGWHCSMMRILDFAAPLIQKAGPGHWNDLDMLEVGNGGMTPTEYQTHFAMWAVIKSPLILGNDLMNMDAVTKAIITNKWLIDINQDPKGEPVARTRKTLIKNPHGETVGVAQIWAGGLVQGAVVAIVNSSPDKYTTKYALQDVYPWAKKLSGAKYEVVDLWALTDPSKGIVEGNWGHSLGKGLSSASYLPVEVPGHGTTVHRWNIIDDQFVDGQHQKVLRAEEL